MNLKRVYAGVAGALVAGVILGSATSGLAATAPGASGQSTSSITAACGNLGLRLGAAMRDSGGRLLDVVAELSGKSADEITAERQAGKTFSQIAADNGVSSQAVVDEALKIRQQLLDAKVKDGTITQAQADAAAANMKTRLTQQVESVNTSCGAGDGSGMGAGMGRGGGRGTGCMAN